MHHQFFDIDPMHLNVLVNHLKIVHVHLILRVPLKKFHQQFVHQQCQHFLVILMDLNISTSNKIKMKKARVFLSYLKIVKQIILPIQQFPMIQHMIVLY